MAMPRKDSLMETQVEIRSEEESKHRLEMAEMEHQLVLELRALGDILEILRLRDGARESPKQIVMQGLRGMVDIPGGFQGICLLRSMMVVSGDLKGDVLAESLELECLHGYVVKKMEVACGCAVGACARTYGAFVYECFIGEVSGSLMFYLLHTSGHYQDL